MNISALVLAEESGVSRTPVRENFKQQTEDLVEIRRRVGIRYDPSWREITELFKMKVLLEGVAVRLLAECNWLPEIDALEENRRSIRLRVCKRFDEVARTSRAASPAAMGGDAFAPTPSPVPAWTCSDPLSHVGG